MVELTRCEPRLAPCGWWDARDGGSDALRTAASALRLEGG